MTGVETPRAASDQPLVLVVDDSEDMRALIHDVLTEQGYEVVTASSGGRALGMMAERLPALVITDLFMPGMNGFTLRGEMLRRSDFADVPVVVLSAFWQRPSETLDVVDVLPKPLNLDRLVEVVARAVDRGSTAGDGPGGESAPAESAPAEAPTQSAPRKRTAPSTSAPASQVERASAPAAPSRG